MTSGLNVSDLISISVNLAALPAQAQPFNTLLVLDTATGVDMNIRARQYGSLTAVGADFASNTDAYGAAAVWFGQSPQPNSIFIGRWAKSATPGQLLGAPISAANQALSVWTAISNGAFKLTVDGGSQQSVTGLNFSGAASLNAVATILSAGLTGATVVWNANYTRFDVTSNTTGATSAVSFATSGASGTDISTLVGWTATAGGYAAAGSAAESALAAVQAIDNKFSGQSYGLVVPGGADSDHTALAAYVEAASVPHYYGVTTSEATALLSTDTTSVGYLLSQGKYKRTTWQYSSSNAYAVVSYLARILTTQWAANNTAIALMYKQEPLVTPETLSESQAVAVKSKNGNVYVNYNNGVPIIQYGTSASGDWTDTIIGLDWLKADMQTRVFNLLYGSTTKVPQTDAGNHQIRTEIEASCQAAANNGLLGPGNWQNAGFGQIQNGTYLSKGYYVYQPPVASQSAADRAARKSVAFQIAAHLAGAVNTVNAIINVG